MAILIGRDDNVSSLFNAEPNMLIWKETVNPVADEQEETIGEAEPLRDEMRDDAASTVVDEPAGGDSTVNGEGENNEDSESFKGVTEQIAIEALRLACSHGSAQSVKLTEGSRPASQGIPSSCMTPQNLVMQSPSTSSSTRGADIEERRSDYNRTPLLHCASLNNDISILETLLRRRANVDAQDVYSKTA